MRSILRLSPIVLVGMVLACAATPTTGDPDGSGQDLVVQTVTVSPDSVDIGLGATQLFSASARNLAGQTVSTTFAWTSSNSSVASVGASTGMVQGAAEGGPVLIRASAGGKVGEGKVRVVDNSLKVSRGMVFSALTAPFPGGPESSEVFIVNAGSRTATNISTHAAIDGEPIWSPDGASVLFVTTRDAPPSDQNNNFGTRSLYRMSATGGSPQRVAYLCTFCDRAFAWNPATGLLHFVRFNSIDQTEGFFVVSGNPGANPIRITTANKLVPAGHAGSYTLDHLAFSHGTNHLAYTFNNQVYVASFSSDPLPHALSPACAFPSTCGYAPVWSPDDQRIAVVRDGGLWTFNVATGAGTRLTDADGLVAPSWSPSGQELAYVSLERVRIVNATTGASQSLAPTIQAVDDAFGRVAWSSDGSMIAFVATNERIMVVRRSDLALGQISYSGSAPSDFAWR